MRDQRPKTEDRRLKKKRVHFLLLLGLWSSVFSLQSFSAYADLGEIPVQHAGRVKPFETFAQETVLQITGKSKVEGMTPTETVWKWLAQPEAWFAKPFIPVTEKHLQQEFGLMLINKKISPQIVLEHQPFMEQVKAALAKQQRKDRLSPVERKRLEIYASALAFQDVANGTTPGWIPNPQNPHAGWLPFQGFLSPEAAYSGEKIESVRNALQQLLSELRENKTPNATATQFQTAMNALQESGSVKPDASMIRRELHYNRLHPFRWADDFYWMALALMIAFALSQKNLFYKSGVLFFFAGFAVHAYGFVLRCLIAGRPPVTNMYESIIWVSWAVVLFSIILFSIYRQIIIPATAAFVASIALAIAQSFPAVLNPAISPLVPVLRSNLWLTVHVLTITLSYGAFALAWGFGHAVIFLMALSPKRQATANKFSEYLYRAMQIGVILLATGTVLGGVWANYSWGRFWGWDPKETWALIALLGYLVVLHGRFAGWLDTFGTALASVLAFLGVLMAWYGVNFVLAAGLHSYGFGGGGLPYVAAVVALDLVLIACLGQAYRNSKIKVQISK